MILLCREIDKNSGKVSAYSLETEITDRILGNLGIRSRLNPELTYYITIKENYESNKELVIKTLKKINLSDKMLQACAAKIGCGIERI